MKLLELQLLAFGAFTNRLINLGSNANKYGLSIVYGPNESGKSTALRALLQFFYGIPLKSTDNFKHANSDMRIAAILENKYGEKFHWVRRKGNAKTLRQMPNDQEIVEESKLVELLANLNQDTYETMFGIDHSELIRGGKAILDGSGELGALLFSASSGISNLKNISDSLEKEYQELYARGATVRKINKEISEYADLKKQLKDVELPSSEWEKHDQLLKQLKQKKNDIDNNLSKTIDLLDRTKKYQEAHIILAERKLYEEKLERVIGLIKDKSEISNPELLFLPDNFEDEVRAINEQIYFFENEDKNDARKIENIEQELSKINVSETVLLLAPQIESLQQELGSHCKAKLDRVRLTESLLELRSKSAQCLLDLGKKADLSIDDVAETMRLTVQEKTRLRNLALKKSNLEQAFTENNLQKQKIEYKIKLLTEELEKSGDYVDLTELKSVLKKLQSDAVLEERLLNDSVKNERNSQLIKNEFIKLDLSKNIIANETIAEISIADLNLRLSTTKSPSLSIVETLVHEIDLLKRKKESFIAQITKLNSEIQELKFRQNELDIRNSVPSEEALLQSRELRNTGWQLVLNSWKSGQTPAMLASDDIYRYCNSINNGADLVSAYETSVFNADKVVDRLRHESNAVAQKIEILVQITKQESVYNELKLSLDIINNEIEQKEKAWHDLWFNLRDELPQLNKAVTWLSQYKQFEQNVQKLASEIQDNLNSLKTFENSKNKLFSILESFSKLLSPEFTSISGNMKLSFSQSLKSLCEETEKYFDKLSKREIRQNELKRDLQNNSIELDNLKNTINESAKQLETLQEQWLTALTKFDFDSELSSEELSAVLDKLEQFFNYYSEIQSFERRIAAIDRDSVAFEQNVKNISEKTEQSELLVEQLASKLYLELKRNIESDQRQKILQNQLKELFEHKEISNSTLLKLYEKREQMCAEAHISNPSSLLELAKLNREKQNLTQLLENYNKQLIRLANNTSLTAYINECLAKSTENLADLVLRLESEKIEFEKEKDSIQINIGIEQQILKSMDGKADASDIALRMQQTLSQMGQNVEQYVKLKFASSILNLAVERYREKNQSPILLKASELFAKLTNYNFNALAQDFNEKGEPILLGKRSLDSSLVNISGMSEGTADQVYLALRLAGIFHYLESKEPVPFIVDDILVNFDDERAISALKVFNELAEKTQVVVFTHHKHLFELAKNSLNSDLTTYIDLSCSSPTYFHHMAQN